MLQTILALWVGDRLSTVERLSLTSFVANGHPVHLYTYGEVEGVPRRVVIKDANDIIHESKIFTYKGRPSYAGFANHFRYELLRKEEGIWVDTDTVCLKPFDFEDEYLFGWQGQECNTAVLKLPSDSEALAHVASLALKPNKWQPWDAPKIKGRKFIRKYFKGNRINDLRWGETGPFGLTNVLKLYGLDGLAKPASWFYPVPYYSWRSLFDETYCDRLDFFDGSYSVHLWNEMLRLDEEFDKDATFPECSLFEVMKKRYGVTSG
ncbi:MAG: hypothetical protein ABFS34_00630 [Gemmatimonadota bacterium]